MRPPERCSAALVPMGTNRHEAVTEEGPRSWGKVCLGSGLRRGGWETTCQVNQVREIKQNQKIPVVGVMTRKGAQGSFWGHSNNGCFFFFCLGDGNMGTFTL